VGRNPLVVASLALAVFGCRDRGVAPTDAGMDGARDDVPNPLTLVIAVTGCASYQAAGRCAGAGEGPCCTGTPPLTLSFSPVGSPELTRFLWTFGDGTPPTTEQAPSHTFAHPGEYKVELVGGSNQIGTLGPARPLQVTVVRLAAGAPCDVDAQCDDGLTCLCQPGTGCSPAFMRGLCSRPCDAAPCGAGAVCAALTVAPAPTAGARVPLCIAGCQTEAECAPGYVCQTVRAGSAAAEVGWTRGCLPLGAARDLGDPCRDANDLLSNDACATGTCADIGALGTCSPGCDDSHPCPDGTRCVSLGGASQLCLKSGCGMDSDCRPDPLLACRSFQTTSMAPAVTVCAPRVCTGDAACAPSGRCGPEGACIRR
jgi:hypothetical protein